jgi:two-component system, NtrC family, sensor kinase
MGRRAKPAKVKVKAQRPLVRKALKEAKDRALAAALDQQTATAAILRIISNSLTDAQPVFDTIVESAVRLCRGTACAVLTCEDESIHVRAQVGERPETREAVQSRFPIALNRDTLVGRVVLDGQVVHVPDFEVPEAAPEGARTVARMVGYRSALFTPMFRDGRPIGVITVGRRDPGPFSEEEIRLMDTFADQAVIAIENVRLFTELQAKNRDLTTALDTQTATSDILRVISSSQADVQPVFEAIAENAARLVRAWSVTVLRWDGRFIHLAAERGGPPGSAQLLRDESPWLPNATSGTGRCIATGTVIHVPDVDLDPEANTATRELARKRGWRSDLNVPMQREGTPIGAISVTRREAGPFSPAEIELLRPSPTRP